MKLKTINILGCCVCRDIFRINEESSKKYKINKFIQSVSPISIIEKDKEKTILKQSDLDIFEDKPNFTKRNIVFDFNKSVQNVIKNNSSDYLIIDLCELRDKISKVTMPDGYEFLITYMRHSNDVLQNNEKIDSIRGIEFTEPFDFDLETIYNYLDKYIKFLKKYYNPDKIILIKNIPTHIHINDKENRFDEINTCSVWNVKEKLNNCYEYFEEKFKGINVINVPDYLLGDANHLWGLDILHFTNDYYTYLYRAFDMIVEREINLKEKLEILRKEYSDYFKLLIDKKRFEYFIYNNPNPNQYLKNEKLKISEGGVDFWRIQTSNGSKFDLETKSLSCADSDVNWAILSQVIDLKSFANQELCLSIKYETFEDSRINLAFRYKSPEGKFICFQVKQLYSKNKISVGQLVFKVPNEMPDNIETDIAIFVNRKNEIAKIYEVKLELGKFSSII